MKAIPFAERAQGKEAKGPQGEIGGGESAGKASPGDEECGEPLEGDGGGVEGEAVRGGEGGLGEKLADADGAAPGNEDSEDEEDGDEIPGHDLDSSLRSE